MPPSSHRLTDVVKKEHKTGGHRPYYSEIPPCCKGKSYISVSQKVVIALTYKIIVVFTKKLVIKLFILPEPATIRVHYHTPEFN